MLSQARALILVSVGVVLCAGSSSLAFADARAGENAEPSLSLKDEFAEPRSDWRHALRTEYTFVQDRAYSLVESVRFTRAPRAASGTESVARTGTNDSVLNDGRFDDAIQSHEFVMSGKGVTAQDEFQFGVPPISNLVTADIAGWATAEEPPAASDIQSMPVFEIRDKAVSFLRLREEIETYELQAKAMERRDMINRKLGNRVHMISTKHFAAGYLTIFYIPVFAGFGFSW